MKYLRSITTLPISLVFVWVFLFGIPSQAQMALNWTPSSSTSYLKVYVLSPINYKFPTSDPYEIGFFKEATTGGLFICFGKADLQLGSVTSFRVSLDPKGEVGYKNKDRFMTFVRNKNTQEVYGADFHYRNDSSTFINQRVIALDSLIRGTWYNFWPSGIVCSNVDTLTLKIPYGLKPDSVKVPSGIQIVSTVNGVYKFLTKNLPTNQSKTISFPIGGFNNTFLSYPFQRYPFTATVASSIIDSLCSTSNITLPVFDKTLGLKRIPVSASVGYVLTTSGSYVYKMVDTLSGCFTYQTVTIKSCTPSKPALYSWGLSTNSSGFTIQIPNSISWSFPSTDGYELGYFVQDTNGNFICVGKTDIISGTKNQLYIFTDPTGAAGYKTGDRFISFIRNKRTLQTYGVEFTYENDSSWYTGQSNLTVKAIAVGTWYNFWPKNTVCQFQDSVYVRLPWGTFPQQSVPSSGTTVRSSTNNGFYLINTNRNVGATFGVTFSVTGLDGAFLSYTANRISNPSGFESVISQDICFGQTISVSTVESALGLPRFPKNTLTSYTLSTPGTYLYTLVDPATGCSSNQTYEIKACTPTKVENSTFFNATTQEYVVFSEPDEWKVYDFSFRKVKSFTAPYQWKGDDDAGRPLPLGLYMVINSKKEVHYFTIAY